MRAAIEFRKPGDDRWDFLGDFTAPPEELATARALLDGCEDPYDVIDSLSEILYDTLDILRKDGFLARVTFKEENRVTAGLQYASCRRTGATDRFEKFTRLKCLP